MARFEALVREEGTMGVIVQRIAEGETLKALAAAWQVPAGRLAQWLIEDRNRNELYVNAVALRETFRTDEIHALGDGVTNKLELGIANLRLKATQWAAAKWNPARFGDSSSVAVKVTDDRLLDRETLVLEAARSIAFLLAQGADVAAGSSPQGLLPPPSSPPATERDVTPPPAEKGPI